MSDLQQEDDGITIHDEPAIQPEDHAVEPTTTAAVADTDKAPPEPEAKQVKFDEDQQKVVDEIIGKKVFKQREAEREAERLRKEMDELRKSIPSQARPVVPDLIDPLSVNDQQYREHISERDERIRQAAAYDARETSIREQQQAAQQASQKQQHEALVKAAETYTSRAAQLGLKPDELQAAGKMVADFGIDGGLAEMILQDDHGPLITKYLANNLVELEQLNALSPYQAAVRIATTIKAKAASLKPKLSTAPDPLNPPRNSGVPPKSYGAEGVIYE